MAELSDFIPWVEASAEGAPRPIVESALRRSMDRFLRYTGLWNLRVDPIQLVDADPDYEIDAPEGAFVTRVSAVHYRGQPLAPVHEGWGAQYTGGYAPYAYSVPPTTPNTLVLFPTPSGTFTSDDTITLLAIYVPTADADTFPDFLATDYLMEIVDGALHYILSIPGKGWSDPTEAERRQKNFMRGCAQGRMRAATGNTVGVLPVAHQYFA